MKTLHRATSYPPRLRRAGRRLVAIAGTALVVSALAIILGTSTASAQTAPVTDYGAYPPSLPAGCPDGPDLLDGLRWATSTSSNTSDLATLGLRPGDTVTASWSAFDPGCTQTDGAAAIIVSLAAYDGGANPFDPRIDQRLVDGWASCGAGAASCQRAGDRYHLALSLPRSGDTCAAQLDLVIGRPLAVVGPSGSYFSNVARNDSGPNNLIASGSLATNSCTAPVPTAPAAQQPAATVPADTTPTTTTVATAPAVTSAAAAPSTTVAAATTAPPAVSAEALAVSPAELPFTGRDIRRTATLAVTVAIVGAALIAVSRRRQVAR
jgi:hypothetical protein